MVDNLDLKVLEDGPPLPVGTRVNFNIDREFVKSDPTPSDPFDENEDRVWNMMEMQINTYCQIHKLNSNYLKTNK